MCALSFAYRHSTPSGSLTISLVVRGQQWSKILQTIIDQTDWNNYTVHIGALGPGFQIKLTGDVYTPNINPYADMELDDIVFEQCDPTVTPPIPNLNCTFETDTCGWFDVNRGAATKLDWVSSLIRPSKKSLSI